MEESTDSEFGSQSLLTLEASTGFMRERTTMSAAIASSKTKSTMAPVATLVKEETPCANHQVAKPTNAAHGRVISHADTMRMATPQRTSAPRRPRPVPRMEPVDTWVVDSAIPPVAEVKMIAAEVASAAMPCGDSISTRPLPRVRITRQPPDRVPAAMATAQETITQVGMRASATACPEATSARKITPMVFCASPAPCARDTRQAVTI